MILLIPIILIIIYWVYKLVTGWDEWCSMKKNNIQKMPNETSADNGTKPHVMRRFLFQYRFDGGADFNVTLDDVNMNKAMEQFAKKYHQVDKVYSIDEVASNGA